MKKYSVLLLAVLMLSACSGRNTPDALTVVKYKKIVVPQNTTSLPVPNANAKALGYQSAQQSVKLSIKLQDSNHKDNSILQAFKIRPVHASIRDNINALKNVTVIVDTKKEEARIADNKKAGRKITDGRTPTHNIGSKKSGIDELFD